MYKLAPEIKLAPESGVIKTNADGSQTHFFEGSRFWEPYQEWLAAGNEPAPAFTAEELAANTQSEINAEALKFLNDTDWKVRRHIDQIALGIETSLTGQMYTELLQERQAARERVK